MPSGKDSTARRHTEDGRRQAETSDLLGVTPAPKVGGPTKKAPGTASLTTTGF